MEVQSTQQPDIYSENVKAKERGARGVGLSRGGAYLTLPASNPLINKHGNELMKWPISWPPTPKLWPLHLTQSPRWWTGNIFSVLAPFVCVCEQKQW